MAFTMHSHSGQFCGHAVDKLEEVVQRAISIGFRTIGLTEHMPRAHKEDLYPEEKGDPDEVLAGLVTTFEAYVKEALRLRAAYGDQIAILVGFETEWIRGAADDGVRIQQIFSHPEIDYYVGSVHHVGASGAPLDYDIPMYQRGVEEAMQKAKANGTYVAAAAGSGSTGASEDPDELYLYLDYYDQQYGMLQSLRPRVIGHFDLVRLLSADPSSNLQTAWGGAVWPKILRNLEFIASYGGWLECNTAALRKGLDEPYPDRPIAEAWLKLGGRFTMSDDSHGTGHVATNYRRGLAYLESLGVKEVWTLTRTLVESPAPGEKTGVLTETAVSLEEFAASLHLEDDPPKKANGEAK